MLKPSQKLVSHSFGIKDLSWSYFKFSYTQKSMETNLTLTDKCKIPTHSAFSTHNIPLTVGFFHIMKSMLDKVFLFFLLNSANHQFSGKKLHQISSTTSLRSFCLNFWLSFQRAKQTSRPRAIATKKKIKTHTHKHRLVLTIWATVSGDG